MFSKQLYHKLKLFQVKKFYLDNEIFFVNNFKYFFYDFICTKKYFMTKNLRRRLLLKFLITLIIFLNFFCVGECKDFIFVTSSSKSMNFSDPAQRVGESVDWFIENLSADDEVGVITFDDSVKILRPLSKVSDNPQKFFKLNYIGQSNAGDAILSAVDMLTPKFHEDKNIIFIGNGEIFCENQTKTLQSLKNFQNALEHAKWQNISVYILNLRYNGNPENYHSFSDLANEIPIPHTELFTTLRTILHNDFHTPNLNFYEKIVQEKNLSATIPIDNAKNIKFFLISSNPGNATADNISKTFNGNFVKTFKTDSTQKNFEIALNYPPQTAVTLDAIIEVEGSLQKNPSSDSLEIIPIDSSGKKIFADNFFENKSVRVKINDKFFDTKIHGGELEIDLSGENKNISLQKVYFEDVGVNFIGDDTAEIILPEYNFLPYILAIAAICVILFLAFRKKKITEKPQEIKNSTEIPKKKITVLPKPIQEKIIPEKKVVENKKIPFNGKFAIYFTKSTQEEEIEPREFNLFRVKDAQINLLEILASCNIEEKFLGAEKILFTPSKKGIFLKNDSDCTILKRNNLIEKGRQIEIFYNDSINIESEDEICEFILMYKSLKPS